MERACPTLAYAAGDSRRVRQGWLVVIGFVQAGAGAILLCICCAMVEGFMSRGMLPSSFSDALAAIYGIMDGLVTAEPLPYSFVDVLSVAFAIFAAFAGACHVYAGGLLVLGQVRSGVPRRTPQRLALISLVLVAVVGAAAVIDGV
jgi:hypothetical protein